MLKASLAKAVADSNERVVELRLLCVVLADVVFANKGVFVVQCRVRRELRRPGRADGNGSGDEGDAAVPACSDTA